MGLRPGKPRAARCAVPALRALAPPVLGLARTPREPGLRASGARFAASFGRGRVGARPVTGLASPALRSRRSARAHFATLRSLSRSATPAPVRARPAPGLALFSIPRPPTTAPSGLPRRCASRRLLDARFARASAAPRIRPQVALVASWRIMAFISRQSLCQPWQRGAPCARLVLPLSGTTTTGRGGQQEQGRTMTDHNSFFDLLGRDVSALLGIAEYLDVLGRDRVASLVRTVTYSIEQTVGDLRRDVLHKPRRSKLKVTTRRARELVHPGDRARRKRASDLVAKRTTAPRPRPKPVTPTAASARISPRALT